MEVDFVSFAGLVDAPGRDHHRRSRTRRRTPRPRACSCPRPAPVELDGDQALAYVRSRHYTETINGEMVEDPTADLGRMERQQAFLTAVFGELSDTKNPFTLAGVASGMAEGLRIDDEMSMFDAIRLGWGMRGSTPEALDLTPPSQRPQRVGRGAHPRRGRGGSPSSTQVR